MTGVELRQAHRRLAKAKDEPKQAEQQTDTSTRASNKRDRLKTMVIDTTTEIDQQYVDARTFGVAEANSYMQ